MKNYVEKFVCLRKENMNVPSLCEFFKLLMNALFGKTCENLENYRKFLLSATAEMGSVFLVKFWRNGETIFSILTQRHF
jgi:hypothetical protein